MTWAETDCAHSKCQSQYDILLSCIHSHSSIWQCLSHKKSLRARAIFSVDWVKLSHSRPTLGGSRSGLRQSASSNRTYVCDEFECLLVLTWVGFGRKLGPGQGQSNIVGRYCIGNGAHWKRVLTWAETDFAHAKRHNQHNIKLSSSN